MHTIRPIHRPDIASHPAPDHADLPSDAGNVNRPKPADPDNPNQPVRPIGLAPSTPPMPADDGGNCNQPQKHGQPQWR